MALETPRLDDRSYHDILEEAMRLIPLYCPEWTDHNPSDPGIALLELFSWMTDIVLYRLNRVPDKHYVKFMELIGMTLRAPEAAHVPISFWLTAPRSVMSQNTITIPGGTAVATIRTEVDPAIVFTTDADAEVRAPNTARIMTSSYVGNRDFIAHDVGALARGSAEVIIFKSNPPEVDDALYIGFENDLSHHIISLNIEVETAEGAGIRVKKPPYDWEVMGGETMDWVTVEVDEDNTRGLNRDGSIQLHLPKMHLGTANKEAMYWLRCRMVDDADRPKYEVSPRIRRLDVKSWGITTRASNVSVIKEEIIGRSDGTSGQRFYLAHTPVVPRHTGERLFVREASSSKRATVWEEVSDFAESTPESRHYTIDDLTGEIRFAPSLPQRDGTIKRYGEVPPKGSVITMSSYRYGGGQIGNVGSSALTVLKSGLPYILRVTNRVPAIGGFDAENLDDCKMRVPGHLRSLGRAVTPADFEHLALEAAAGDIARVRCLPSNQSAPGEIQLLAIPTVPTLQDMINPESLRLRPEVRDQMTLYLDERRLLGTRLVVREPEYQWVSVDVELQPVNRINQEEVRARINARLHQFLNPITGGDHGKGWEFGRTLTIGDIFAALRDVSGVEIVRSVTIIPVTYHDGIFDAGITTDRLDLAPDCTLTSYRHEVIFTV